MSLPIFHFKQSDLNLYKKRRFNFQSLLNNYLPNSWEYKYVKKIESSIEDILIGTLNQLKAIKKELMGIYDLSTQKCLNPVQGKACNYCNNCRARILSSSVQELLGYAPNKVLKLFVGLNNRACYICNAHHTIFAYENPLNKTPPFPKIVPNPTKPIACLVLQSKTVAKFQFDHYYPKSIYPAFSLSLFNLVPICSYCNQKKHNNEYDLENLNDQLKYGLEESSIVEYYNNGGSLKVTLEDRTKDSIAKKFDLKGIYDNHTDTVEEILARKIKYTDSYKTALKKKFPHIVIKEKVIEDRLILGMYEKTDGFHKRPLSKFIHDINDELDSF